MKAVRVHAFGGLDAMVFEDVARPNPGPGQVRLRVAAAGVGPWDAWIREGKSVLPQPLPLTLGSDLSGVVEAVGPEVSGVRPGDEMFGITDQRFTGAYAEAALAEVAMIAPKPAQLSHIDAASIPVVASTAQQMLFEHAHVQSGQTVLILGGGGNVGAYAVQLAHLAGARVVAVASAREADRVQSLGAAEVIGRDEPPPLHLAARADIVIDTVGGDALARSFAWLRRGGIVVSAVAEPDQESAARHGVRAKFILVSVTASELAHLAGLIAANRLRTNVGEILPLSDARTAHEMLAGRKHRPGKIVLVPGA